MNVGHSGRGTFSRSIADVTNATHFSSDSVILAGHCGESGFAEILWCLCFPQEMENLNSHLPIHTGCCELFFGKENGAKFRSEIMELHGKFFIRNEKRHDYGKQSANFHSEQAKFLLDQTSMFLENVKKRPKEYFFTNGSADETKSSFWCIIYNGDCTFSLSNTGISMCLNGKKIPIVFNVGESEVIEILSTGFYERKEEFSGDEFIKNIEKSLLDSKESEEARKKIFASSSAFWAHKMESLDDLECVCELFSGFQKTSVSLIRHFDVACAMSFLKGCRQGDLVEKINCSNLKMRVFLFIQRVLLLESLIKGKEKGNIFKIKSMLKEDIRYVNKYLRKLIPANADENARAKFEEIYTFLLENFEKYDADWKSISGDMTEATPPQGMSKKITSAEDDGEEEIIENAGRIPGDLVAELDVFRRKFHGEQSVEGKISCLVSAMEYPKNIFEFVPLEAVQRIGLLRELGALLPPDVSEEIQMEGNPQILTERMMKYVDLEKHIRALFASRGVEASRFAADVQLQNVFYLLQLHIEIYYNRIAKLRAKYFNEQFSGKAIAHPDNIWISLGVSIPKLTASDHVISESDRVMRRQLLCLKETIHSNIGQDSDDSKLPCEFKKFIDDNIVMPVAKFLL